MIQDCYFKTMLHGIASKSTDIFRLSAVSNPRHYYNSKLFVLYKDIIAMNFCFVFSILIKAQFHQQWSRKQSYKKVYVLTGWGSFHQRNNSFREHNTLFSEHMQPSSYNTIRPTRNTADPYFTMTELSPIKI